MIRAGSMAAHQTPRLKIMFVIDSLGSGGSERSLVELFPHLRRSNIDSVIVCLKQANDGFLEQVRSQGYRVHFLSRGKIGRFFQLRKLINNERPDIIHTTLFNADILGRLAAVGFSCPVVSSLVNVSYNPVRLQDSNIRPRRLRAAQKIDSITGRYCTTHFHAVSESVKLAAMRDLRISSDKITVVERGRDEIRIGVWNSERHRSARRKFGLKEAQPVLVTVGRQEYQKGQAFLLRAVSLLKQEYGEIFLLMAGRDGNATRTLNKIFAESSLEGNVKFLGFRDDIPDILAAADIFVFPSLYEGLPGAVIEAMAMGLPIVASDIPALREVVEADNNAILFRPGSAELLADAVSALLKDRNRMLLFGKRSRAIFEEKFKIERSAARMIEMYHKIAFGLSSVPANV